jgi:hypothetical protein
MPRSIPTRARRIPVAAGAASLALALVATAAAAAPPAPLEFKLKNVVVSSYDAGARSDQTLQCERPGRDGSARCTLRDQSGKIIARGTLRRQGRPAADAAAEAAVWKRIFANPATRAQVNSTPSGIGIRMPEAGDEVLVGLLLPAIQSAREAARSPQRKPGSVANPEHPAAAGGRGYEPVKGLVGGLGQDVLTLQQLGGTTANVAMKQGSCGLDCGTWVLATAGGNLSVPFKIGLACSPGKTAVYLAYQLASDKLVKLLDRDSGQLSVAQTLDLQPFSAADLEKACQAALGGSWAKPNSPKNTSSTAHTHLAETIRLWGRCAGETANAMRDFPVNLAITCQVQGS